MYRHNYTYIITFIVFHVEHFDVLQALAPIWYRFSN